MSSFFNGEMHIELKARRWSSRRACTVADLVNAARQHAVMGSMIGDNSKAKKSIVISKVVGGLRLRQAFEVVQLSPL